MSRDRDRGEIRDDSFGTNETDACLEVARTYRDGGGDRAPVVAALGGLRARALPPRGGVAHRSGRAFSSALGSVTGLRASLVFRRPSFSTNRSRHDSRKLQAATTKRMSAAVGAAAGAAPAPGVARVSGMRKCASMASRFPAAACQFRAAPSTGAWAPSPSHRRHADDAARRLSVRAASSKASKVGRFPPTPATDAHPLVEEGVDLGELCAQWRADAGKPGATVMREVQTMLRGGDARRHLAAADGFGHFDSLSASDAEDSEDWRLLLSHKNENLYNAFALEVAALAPKSTGLTTGLFALPKPLPEPTLARMAGLRATVDPLACAADADALAEAVRALRVGSSLGATPVALYHDCVARHPTRIPSPELYDAMRDAMEAWGGGFKHGVYARFKNPNDPESIRGARETLRFCVVETSAGYVFGLCTYAPPRFHAKVDWSRKPNNYSAGTQPSIAGVAVNAVFAPGGDEKDEPWAVRRARGVILDPCCGGGTILHAAWSRGYRAMGGDINAQNARNANGNLASFRRAMPAQHASLAECDAGTPYELEGLRVVGDFDEKEKNADDETSSADDTSDDARGDDHPSEPIRVSSARRPSRMLTPTPTVTVADAITVSPAAWRAAAAERFGDPVARVAAVVSNLPFGRQVSVGGKLGGGRRGEATMEELEPLLLALRDVAPRHAFVTGAPVASTMRALGYSNVTDVSLCRHGRMYLTTAYGERGAYDAETLRDLNRLERVAGETSSSSSPRRTNAPRPSVAFTVEASEKARAENGYVYGDVPEWVERLIASGDVDRASGSRRRRQKSVSPEATGGDEGDAASRRFSRPPLRVAVDTSYEQDSARAIRSVAKQLSECIGVKRRARKDAAPEHAVDVQLTFAGWRGAVAEHALQHFNAARWTEAAMDPRDVEEIFRAAETGIPLPADSEEDAGAVGDASRSRGGSPASPPRRLVYLSPDADEALEDVEEDTMYVIGGIVDLAARGVAWSLPKATALGIRAARLPIRENLPSVTNQILNIDTALKVLCEKYSGKDWEDALRAALPTRQQGERPARKNRPLVSAETREP